MAKFEKSIIEKLTGKEIEFQAAPDRHVYPAHTRFIGFLVVFFYITEILSFLMFVVDDLPFNALWRTFNLEEKSIIISAYLFFFLSNTLLLSVFEFIYNFRKKALVYCFLGATVFTLLICIMVGNTNTRVFLGILFALNTLLILLEIIKPTTLEDVKNLRDEYKF